MKTIPLGEYLASHGTQNDLAKALGIQQSAISQMLSAKRDIRISIHPDGRIEASEVRPIPVRRPSPDHESHPTDTALAP